MKDIIGKMRLFWSQKIMIMFAIILYKYVLVSELLIGKMFPYIWQYM